MGKGNRNRDAHVQERTQNPKKYQTTKKTPAWVKPLVSIVVLVAVLFGAAAWIVAANGIVERNRVLVESTSGKYDLTQQMATYLVWQSSYSTYYSLSEYYLSSSSSSTTTTSAEEKESQKLQFALQYSQMAVQEQLRDGIESMLPDMQTYVALCDKAVEEGYTLTEEEIANIDEQVEWLWKIKEAIGYYAASKNKFLSVITVSGMKVKDVRAALELMTLAESFRLDYQAKKDAGLAADPEMEKLLADYRDANLASFYSADYLSYVSEDKALVEKLATATSADMFQELLIKHVFDAKYELFFNRYTTQVDAKADLEKIEGKKDNENGTAWTEGVTAIWGEEAAVQYTNDDTFTLPAEVKDWMFASVRAKFDTLLVTTQDADDKVVVYLVALDEVTEAGKTVKAHVKAYATADGVSYDEKENFKDLVLAYVKHELMSFEPSEADEEIIHAYKSGADKANDLKLALNKADADVDAILNGVEDWTKITASSTDAEKSAVPSKITEALKNLNTKGAQVVEIDFDTAYLVCVSKIENGVKEYQYASFESDVFNQIGDSLIAELEENYPSEKSVSYTENDGNDELTFKEWASELSADKKLPFVRVAGEAKWFTEKENVKDDAGKDKLDANGNVVTKDVYAAYVIVKGMHYEEEAQAYLGGFLNVVDDVAAESLKAKLAGQTYSELIFNFYVQGATTSYSEPMTASKLTDTKVKAWFDAAERVANEIGVVTGADGKTYVVVFVGKTAEWKAKASMGYVNESVESWSDSLASAYTPNEKALDKIGEKTTTTAATA